MKECFGLELANRFFSGAFGATDEPRERQSKRAECYGCPDFEHCYMVLDVVYKLRLAEEARRGTAKPVGKGA